MITRNVKISFNLLFKKSIFLDNKEYHEDLVSRDLIYNQLAFEVAEGTFPVSTDVAVRLSALKQAAEAKSGRLFDYKRTIPPAMQNEKSDGEWKETIGRTYAGLSTMQPDAAIDEWLATAARQPMYGSTVFPEVSVKDTKGTGTYDLAINRHGESKNIPNHF